ncbi:hypothetical protein FG379_002347 [Cryptosporidium bovis]|uniref:uncharacterized protein n=1 Tax=Cryptosporidium bovis TaxID=310047 RepID=UPI00351A6789|nr:hypothetical protein FG379_002347 [Cryptosporidium bovis]
MSSNKLISLSKVSILDLLEIRGKHCQNQDKSNNIIKEMTSLENINQRIREVNKCPIVIEGEKKSEDELGIYKNSSLIENNINECYFTNVNKYSIKEKGGNLGNRNSEKINTTFGLWNKIQNDIDSITSVK